MEMHAVAEEVRAVLDVLHLCWLFFLLGALFFIEWCVELGPMIARLVSDVGGL